MKLAKKNKVTGDCFSHFASNHRLLFPHSVSWWHLWVAVGDLRSLLGTCGGCWGPWGGCWGPAVAGGCSPRSSCSQPAGSGGLCSALTWISLFCPRATGLFPIPRKAMARSDTSLCSEVSPDVVLVFPLPHSHTAPLPPSAFPPAFLRLGQVGKTESAVCPEKLCCGRHGVISFLG